MTDSPSEKEAPSPSPVSPEQAAPPGEEESVKEKLDKAGKAAKGTFGVLKAIVRPLLPKKWTGRNIAIMIVVVIVLIVLLWWVLNTIMWMLKWLIVAAFVGAGLYLLFAPRK